MSIFFVFQLIEKKPRVEKEKKNVNKKAAVAANGEQSDVTSGSYYYDSYEIFFFEFFFVLKNLTFCFYILFLSMLLLFVCS